MWDALGALVPSVGVGLIFWFAIRAMLHADRRERQVMARFDAEAQRDASAAGQAPASDGGTVSEDSGSNAERPSREGQG